MKKLSLLLFIVILSLTSAKDSLAQGFAEKSILDSLKEELNKENQHDTIYIQLLTEIGEQQPIFRVTYWDTIVNLSENALEVHHTPQIKKSLLISLASSLNNVGYIHTHQGDINKGLKYYHKSLEIQEKIGDKQGIANSIINIGYNNSSLGNLPKAIEYFHKSLKICEETDNKRGISISLNNIGFIYKDQGDMVKALEFFQKSLKIDEEIDNKSGIATSLNNIGLIYDIQGDFKRALEYYKKSYKIQVENDNKPGIAMCLNNLGNIYKNLGDATKSLEYHLKSLKLNETIGNKNGTTLSLINIGTLHKIEGDNPKALEYGKKGLALAQKINYPDKIKSAAHLLSNVYQKLGNYKEALEMRNLEIQMRDSINNEATQKATAQQEAKYEYEKQKTIDDAAHDKQIALEQEEQKKQRIISISIGVGLLLVVIFLLFVFNRLRVTRKQKQIIEIQRDEVEEAHKEIRDSINYAERIQRSFLATDELLNNNLKDYFVFFQPKDVVSGDFYWAGKLANNQFAVVNADSTGHGVPGAIMSILNISSIEKAIDNKLVKPADIFNHTRDTIIERLSKDGSEEGGKDGMDASIIAFDFENNKFSYTAAQNPIWVIRNNELIEIKAEKMPIGKHDNDSTPFVGGEFEIQKGDVIYSITDGFQDQFGGEKGKKFKVKPFKDYLISIAHLPMQEQREKLYKTFSKWKGEEEQVDDVCVIGVRV